jgi:hypothetical protein
MTDGLSVTNSLDGATYSSHVAPFVSLIRGLHSTAARWD